MQIKINLNNADGSQEFEGSNLTGEQANSLIEAFASSITPRRMIVGTAEAASAPIDWSYLSSEPITGIVTTPPTIENIGTPLQNMKDMVAPLKPFNPKTATQEQTYTPPRTSTVDDDVEDHEYVPAKVEKATVAYKDNHSGFGTSVGEKFNEAFEKKVSDMFTPKKPSEWEMPDAPYMPTDTSHFETGIKYKTVDDVQNVPMYKCRWFCPNPVCNGKGNHYVPEGTKTVFCYNCNIKLKVVEASDEGFPNRDNFGNYYMATEQI